MRMASSSLVCGHGAAIDDVDVRGGEVVLQLVHGAERRGALDTLERLRDLVHVLDVRVQMGLLAERRRADLQSSNIFRSYF